MENNQIIKQVIDEIKTDILTNRSFLAEILANVKLTEKNIDPNLILTLMRELSITKPAPRPKANAPKLRKNVAQPLPVGQDSKTSKIISDLLEGNNVYLMGKAGTGKTFLAKKLAETVMGQPTYVINCSQWTSPIEIRGGQTIKGYEEGLLIKAWATGGILILDELPKLDPNTAGLLNDALAEAAKQPIYNEDGSVDESSIPTITNGRGQKIKKGQDLAPDDDLRFRFCVIATGNTDMMNVGNKYSGNQRQDYSLVDRFAGSYYTIESDPIGEAKLVYAYVFNVCNAMRNFLETVDVLQSISLRTMLNFNRTFEQQMLYKIDSPFADTIKDNNGKNVSPKSINDSIDSFMSLLDKNIREQLDENQEFKSAKASFPSDEQFQKEFENQYGLNPKTGEPI
jgi:cobaltochelatase CobS